MTLEHATRPTIEVDGSALDRSLEPLIERVVVDDHLHLPDMFAITLRDPDRDVLGRAGISIGGSVRISGTPMRENTETLLINGEVTALEGEYETDGARLVIRGYDPSHRLVGGRRTATYQDVTDSDISRTIADRAGVDAGRIDEAGISHEHVSQANTSDWDFLRSRAHEVGFDVAIADGRLDFRRPEEAAGAPDAGDYRSADPLQLVMGSNLLRFYPRITAAEQVREVEVRGWDPGQKRAVVGTAPAATTSVELSDTPADLAEVVGRERWVEAGQPLSDQSAVDRAAEAGAERIASSFAEAEGVARGHPGLKSGTSVSVSGVAEPFAGRYTLTHTRHVFDDDGYRTHLVISGRQDRSLLGLTSAGGNGSSAGRDRIIGLTVALVTDNDDPQSLGRVKLRFPTFDEDYESDWVRVAMPGAGDARGLITLPEVNDEVLVGFESGDIRRPYVLGGLFNGEDSPPLGDGLFDNGSVRRRGFVSRDNHRLVFLDDSDPSGVCLISGDDQLRLALKQSDSSIDIHSAGSIDIQADQDITISARGRLVLSGDRGVDIDGAMIELN